MEKITLQTPNLTARNIDRIAELFPNCITETKDENGTLKKAVNFDVLKQMLSEDVIEGNEAYEFTWVGKKAATVEAFKSINKTLRPCPEESVDWDSTQNLYIEGDNLEVLKLLQESYLKKVKMIYIDPPYNTGNDFIYKDDFRMSEEEWDEESGEYDDEGNRLFRNTESNGRFHSDWCSMIYSRLLLARGLLTDDGVIFISIDDNEIENLSKICNEVFGESNFVGRMTLLSNPRGSQNSKNLSYVHESILMYSKCIERLDISGIKKSDDSLKEFSDKDENGRYYRLLGLRKRGGDWRKEDRPNMFYPVYVNPATGKCSLEKSSDYCIEVIPKRPTGELSRWTWGKEKFLLEKDHLIGKAVNRSTESNAWDIFRKDYKDNTDGTEKTTKLKTMWIEKETNYQNAKNEIKDLFGNSEMFDFPKPIYIVQRLATIATNTDDLILDFFSGSASTAHAVMQLNAEDGGNRRFIMVQIPEECDEKSEAYKAGYKNICEIGKERIRRAGEKIKESMAADDSLFSSSTPGLDTGFRVFKVADSNMKDVEIQLKWYTQNKLGTMVENIKADRTALDLLFGSALEWGYELTLPYTSQQVDGCTIHTYSTGEKVLMACFDKNIPESVFQYIAKQTPKCAVFRDCCFEDCPSKINAEEIIKTLSPDTDVRVI